jgi:hypothetical protein
MVFIVLLSELVVEVLMLFAIVTELMKLGGKNFCEISGIVHLLGTSLSICWTSNIYMSAKCQLNCDANRQEEGLSRWVLLSIGVLLPLTCCVVYISFVE